MNEMWMNFRQKLCVIVLMLTVKSREFFPLGQQCKWQWPAWMWPNRCLHARESLRYGIHMLLSHSISTPRTCKNFIQKFHQFEISLPLLIFALLMLLTWKIRTQIAVQRVPLWPSPSMSVASKSLGYSSNCDNPKRPKIQVQRMEWTMHGRACAPILHINVSGIDTSDTIKSLQMTGNTKKIFG